MKQKSVTFLIAEDDSFFRMEIVHILQKYGHVIEVDNEKEAIEVINSQHIDLALIDMQIDQDKSGISILKAAKDFRVHSIILSSVDSEDVILEAYEAGCDHFLSKMHYNKTLESYITKFIKFDLTSYLKSFFEKKFITQDIELIQSIKRLSSINLKNQVLLITGETGVGKSYIGKLMHDLSAGKNAPFIHLNCSEISENLMASELFGHMKGSFTGAISDKKGKLEQADGGTLFLDEIGTMTISMQKKLLKAIDEKTFYPVGSNKAIKSNFTLITATCEDLEEKIKNQEFREDFYFRINGFKLNIMPLRDRRDDIEPLIRFLQAKSPRRFVLRQQVIDQLKMYSWPGNVRELDKTISFFSLQTKGIIELEDIPEDILKVEKMSVSPSGLFNETISESISQLGLKETVRIIEKQALNHYMELNNNKVTKAIKDLQISSSAFYRIFDEKK